MLLRIQNDNGAWGLNDSMVEANFVVLYGGAYSSFRASAAGFRLCVLEHWGPACAEAAS